MEKLLRKFERFIIIGLLAMMVLVVLLATIELAVILVEQAFEPPSFLLLDIRDMLTIFGFFMMILIGIELIEVIEVYLKEEVIHVEVIFLVAIIAIARKVIIFDVKEVEPLALIGVAAIIIALSAGYFLVKKGLDTQPPKELE
jgi:uncharacterized membrane protein (DUF373 family)